MICESLVFYQFGICINETSPYENNKSVVNAYVSFYDTKLLDIRVQYFYLVKELVMASVVYSCILCLDYNNRAVKCIRLDAHLVDTVYKLGVDAFQHLPLSLHENNESNFIIKDFTLTKIHWNALAFHPSCINVKRSVDQFLLGWIYLQTRSKSIVHPPI